MVTKEEVIQLLSEVKDPFLHRTFAETEGIVDVTIREEQRHVSVKLAIGKPNTAEQWNYNKKLLQY